LEEKDLETAGAEFTKHNKEIEERLNENPENRGGLKFGDRLSGYMMGAL